MEIYIFYIILLSFFSNFVVYLFYKYYISKKLNYIIIKLKEYDERLGKIVSDKRKEKVQKKIQNEIKSYNSTMYFYSFMQTTLLIFIYFIDLSLVVFRMNFNVCLPYYIPLISIQYNGKYIIPYSSFIIFILSFVLFTPISLRRPKII